MKKSLLVKAATVLTGILTLIATAAAASACWNWFYQPEEPKALSKN